MTDKDFKGYLYENGFTPKQMSVIERTMQRSKMTLEEVLRDLSLKFLKAAFVLFIFLAVACYEIFYRGNADIIPFVFILLIFVFIVNFFVPIRLASKVFVFLTKERMR